jgi:hypothetical protein
MRFDDRAARDGLAALLGRMQASIGSYIPDNTWLVAASEAAADEAAQQPGVLVVGACNPSIRHLYIIIHDEGAPHTLVLWKHASCGLLSHGRSNP